MVRVEWSVWENERRLVYLNYVTLLITWIMWSISKQSWMSGNIRYLNFQLKTIHIFKTYWGQWFSSSPVVILKSLAPFRLFIAQVIRKYKKVKTEIKLLVGSGLLVKTLCFLNSKKSLMWFFTLICCSFIALILFRLCGGCYLALRY